MGFIDAQTISDQVQLLGHLMKTARCDLPSCGFISHYPTKQVRHVEGHFFLFVWGSGYGYISSSRNCVGAHINMQHPKDTWAIVHVNLEN